MVNDPSTNELIRWSNDGTSFIVTRPTELAKRILPQYFKHDHFSSFVRQLNTYGFHKVPQLQQGVLRPDHNAGMDVIEFANPRFRRDQPDLLLLVQRKRSSKSKSKQKAKKTSSTVAAKSSAALSSSPLASPASSFLSPSTTNITTPAASTPVTPTTPLFSSTNTIASSPTLSASSVSLPPTPILAPSIPMSSTSSVFPHSPLLHNQQQQQQEQKPNFSDADVQKMMDEMTAIKSHQTTISNELKQMQGDNQVLWQEILTARERNHQHQDTINKILRFLASVYTSNSNGTSTPALSNSSSQAGGHSLGDKKQHLMLGVEQQDHLQATLLSPLTAATSPCPSTVSPLLSASASPVFDLNDLVEVPQTIDQDQLQSSLSHLTQMSQHDVFWNPTTGTSTATTLLPEMTSQIQTLGNAASSMNQNIDQLDNNVEALAKQLGIQPHHHHPHPQQEQQGGIPSIPI
ncbi:hypothetical protein INT45_013255, partial [Circinella minor]